jgi:hypothetical protein
MSIPESIEDQFEVAAAELRDALECHEYVEWMEAARDPGFSPDVALMVTRALRDAHLEQRARGLKALRLVEKLVAKLTEKLNEEAE